MSREKGCLRTPGHQHAEDDHPLSSSCDAPARSSQLGRGEPFGHSFVGQARHPPRTASPPGDRAGFTGAGGRPTTGSSLSGGPRRLTTPPAARFAGSSSRSFTIGPWTRSGGGKRLRRRAERASNLEPATGEGVAENVVEDVYLSTRRKETGEALEKLSTEQRRMLELAYFGGCT